MTTAKKIKRLIFDTELKYQECWDILSSLKSQPSGKLPLFQSLLGETLFNLAAAYNEISGYRRELISRKSTFSPSWFVGRMKALARYQDAIDRIIGTGKSMGDAFAWFFYQNDRELLVEHAKQERVDYLSTGIGGRGELEFIRNVKLIRGLLVLGAFPSFRSGFQQSQV